MTSTAKAILAVAASAGLRVEVSPNGGLRIAGHREAVAKWTPVLRAAKTEIILALSATENISIEQDAFEERAAICEHDGELSRDHAEQLAALHAAPLPAGVIEEQRVIVIDATARFLDHTKRPSDSVQALSPACRRHAQRDGRLIAVGGKATFARLHRFERGSQERDGLRYSAKRVLDETATGRQPRRRGDN